MIVLEYSDVMALYTSAFQGEILYFIVLQPHSFNSLRYQLHFNT